MGCEYCKRIIGHDYRCPNYMPEIKEHYCSICGEYIYSDEEYTVNDDEYVHYDCLLDINERGDFDN